MIPTGGRARRCSRRACGGCRRRRRGGGRRRLPLVGADLDREGVAGLRVGDRDERAVVVRTPEQPHVDAVADTVIELAQSGGGVRVHGATLAPVRLLGHRATRRIARGMTAGRGAAVRRAPTPPRRAGTSARAASRSSSSCSRASERHVANASAWPIAALPPAAGAAPRAPAGHEDVARGPEVAAIAAEQLVDDRHRRAVAQEVRHHALVRAVVGVELGERGLETLVRVADRGPAPEIGRRIGLRAQCAGRRRTAPARRGNAGRRSSAGPRARSATALTEVLGGPSVPCSSTALSVIRRRVSASSSARRFIRYLRFPSDIGVRSILTDPRGRYHFARH